jgi:hypothetical protein
MSTEPTFEQARRCPICEHPGAQIDQRQGPRGSKIHTIECRNTRCRWNNTTWIIQVHPDGTVQPATDHTKNYPKIPDHTDAVQKSMQVLYEQSLRKGGEVQR